VYTLSTWNEAVCTENTWNESVLTLRLCKQMCTCTYYEIARNAQKVEYVGEVEIKIENILGRLSRA
jgi:hypothetical protein